MKRIITLLCVIVSLISFADASEKPLPKPAADPGEQNRTSPKSPADYRLPTSLYPLHYLVKLQPFLYGNFSFHGFAEITFQVAKTTNHITLHIRDIITRNETVKVYPIHDITSTIKILSQKYDKTREFYVATLAEDLLEKSIYIMEINYEGFLNDKLDGFYSSSYLDDRGNKRWLAATQFQATDGRMAFPCFDEPALKAEFTIEIIRPENMTSIANMPLDKTLPVVDQPGWFVDKFQKSVKMSTYLVAFMVSDFTFIESAVHNETRMSVWARDAVIHQTNYALEKGRETLLFFENYFNITFPLPKTDMVALPDFSAGAMENWGLINYRETALVYDPEISTSHNKYVVGSIIAHELAHQWFGNLVTPYWWTDLWLNEGFATWMAAVGHDAMEPEMKVMEQFSLTIRGALLADSLENSHPISIPVGHPDEIMEIFDSISYSKGATLLRMISQFLTEDTFKKGLSNYLTDFAYSHAHQDDLWQHLTEQGKLDLKLPLNISVKEIMDTWTLQMGYPVVNVVLLANGSAILTQERFLKFKRANISDELVDFKWWIPVTFATESNPDFSKTNPKIWMMPSESTKIISGLPNLENQWIVFNNLQSGFYRVNYELEHWNKIVAQFNKNHSIFPVMTRSQLIGDVFHLARAGMITYNIPLSLIEYLKQETEYVPLKTAIYDSSFIRGIMKYTKYENLTKQFMLPLITPHYDKVGFTDRSNDSYMDQSMRSLLLPEACRLDYQPCLEGASQLYHKWMEDPANDSIISPNVRGTVYCMAMKQGGRKEWDFAWKQYGILTLESQKHSLLSALGCTLNNTLRKEYLDLMFTQNGLVRKQDVSRSFGSICRDREGNLLAWNYLRQHWDSIYEYLGNKLRAIGLLRTAVGHIKSHEELQELDNFIESREDFNETGIRSIQQMRENLLGDIHWLEDNLESVGNWLLNKVKA